MVTRNDYFILKKMNERHFDEVLLWLREVKEKGLPQEEIDQILEIFRISCNQIDNFCLKGCVRIRTEEEG